MPDYSTTGAVFPLKTYAITDVDTGTEEFVIDGDQTVRFQDGDEFSVVGSTGNDGAYTVASTSYSEVGDETTITVNEDITDATIDGTIVHREVADPLPITEAHDDASDRDAAEPEEYAGAHGRRLANELRALGKTAGEVLGLEIVDGGGLVVYYTGAKVLKGSGTPVFVSPGTLTLADNDDSYVEVDIAGAVSSNVVGFTTGKYPLAIVTTLAGVITNIVDTRSAIYLAEFAEANLDDFGPSFNSATELTIAGGVITKTQGVHRVDTEGDAATDDLDTINGATVPTLLFIRAENAARIVTLKDGAGNLDLDGKDIVLDNIEVYVILLYDDTTSTWIIAGGGGGGGVSPPSNDNRLVRTDGLTGDIQESGVILDDNDNIYDLVSLSMGADGVPLTGTDIYIREANLQVDDTTGRHRSIYLKETLTDTGTSTADDEDYTSMQLIGEMWDSGGFLDEMFGLNITQNVVDGTVQDIYGFKVQIGTINLSTSPVIQDEFYAADIRGVIDGGVVNAEMIGTRNRIAADSFFGAVTINDIMVALENRVDISSGCTINSNVYGARFQGDLGSAPAGTAYMIYINGGSNWDYAIYQNDSYPNYLGGPLEIIGVTTMSGGRSNGAPTELTLDASGIITITKGYHRVDTFGDAASDDLVTINGGVDGEMLILRAENDGRTVVVKDGTGNLALNGDFSLDNIEDTISLIYDATQSKWLETSRSDNGA